MPDRSKKRKRNKNKRKNNNNPQNGQNSKVTGVSPDAGSCDESVTSEVNDNSVITESNSELLQEDVQINKDEVTKVKPEIDKSDTKVKDQISEGINKFVDNVSRSLATETYIVESPEQLKQSEKTKFSEIPKSKSLDNEDVPKIVEVTEEVEIRSDDENAIGLLDCTALVSEAESDVEWEVADDLISESLTCESATAVGLSVDTLPLNIAECEHTQALSPEEELSLRQYLQTLNLVTCPQEVAAIEVEDIAIKQRKKGVTDDTCKSKPLVSRFLDVIDEEGSNESSITSRRQSYLKDDFEDLEDDVFNKKQAKSETLDKFPLPKSVKIHANNNNARLIPQECLLVGAKIVQPKLDEGRGEWTVQNVARMTGAEVVYLTDSSSSASDIYDVGEDPDNTEDTDSSVRITTPVIEMNNEQRFLAENNTNESNLCKIKTNYVLKTPPPSPQIFVSDENGLEKKSIITDENREIEVISFENKSPSLFVLHIDEDHISEKGKSHNENTNGMSSNKNATKSIASVTEKQNVVEKNVTNNETENGNDKNDVPHFQIQEPKRLIDNEINDLKLELNNALSSLIKEVAAEINNENVLTKENLLCRQDSSSSVGSSQCTAKYNPTTSSLTDIAALVHDDTTSLNKPETHVTENKESHVKDVFEHVSGTTLEGNQISLSKKYQPKLLKDLCVRNIASLPYGERILEELASVSERLQNINIYNFKTPTSENMSFYPSPDVSVIKKVTLTTRNHNVLFAQTKSSPPPIAPRNSSLKKTIDEPSWTGVPTKMDPSLYVCLSPSQKMLIEKTQTVIDKEDANELLDIHRKYIDRRGYKEYYAKGIKPETEKKYSPGTIPFKSQTGNRLLAIISDPGINNNINTKLNKWNQCNNNTKEKTAFSNLKKEEQPNNKCYDSYLAKDLRSEITFRPIPPPRPRKYSSAIYESDESSDFTDHSFQSVSENKYFHYSTGNLNEEIENDVSCIQDMHRKHASARENFKERFLKAIDESRRRPSLPKDICEQQMEYIRQKEKEVEAEISRLESEKTNAFTFQRRGPRAPLYSESDVSEEQRFNANNYQISRKRDMALHSDSHENGSKHISSSFKSSQEEILREKMYSEYMCQMAEREERKQHKIIKITTQPLTNDSKTVSASLPVLSYFNEMRTPNNIIEEEFISKAKERWDKLGIKDPETEDERDKREEYTEPKVIKHKIKVIEGGEEKDVQRLPSHLREFVKFTAGDTSAASGGSPETVMIAPTFKARATSPAVWSPGGAPPPPPPAAPAPRSPGAGASPPPPPPPPSWSPAGTSPRAPRRPFRPPANDDTKPPASDVSQQGGRGTWESAPQLADAAARRLPTSHSAPPAGLTSLGGRLPRAQNPTVTLLQKNREGVVARGACQPQSQEQRARPRDRPAPPTTDPVHALRREYASEGEAGGLRGRNMAAADTPRKVDGIGPTTKEGMPVALRSEVKDPSRWYKKMYDTIHKNKYDGEPSLQRGGGGRSQYAYFDPRSGYLSEPEGGAARPGGGWSDAYDSDAAGPRRRTASVQGDTRDYDQPPTPYMPSNKYSTLASARASQEIYKNQPGKIENYMPGRSSVVDKEAKQWWDEVMDIFDGWLDDNSPLPQYGTLLARAIQKSQLSSASTNSLQQPSPKEKKDITSAILSKSNMARALKESGYESDSTLVFRRRADDTEAPLSPAERRAAYRDLQAGGEPPIRGFRSPAPPRHQDDSEIEYIPISPTLTKIRIHKKSRPREVICYPVQEARDTTGPIFHKFKRSSPSFIGLNIHTSQTELPPAPPRRVSSRNNRTLKLVSSVRPSSASPPKRIPRSFDAQSNVNFLKDKINSKLFRQGTQIISKSRVSDLNMKSEIKDRTNRALSTSAPPALNRNKLSTSSPTIPKCLPKKQSPDIKTTCTSSFGSPRRTIPPIQYSNPTHGRYENPAPMRIQIQGGAGRRAPITNILDKVTSLDRLWGSEQRIGVPSQNKPNFKMPLSSRSYSLSKAASTSDIKTKKNTSPSFSKTDAHKSTGNISTNMTITTSPRGRHLIRSSDKVSKLRQSNPLAKSSPSLTSHNTSRSARSAELQFSSFPRQCLGSSSKTTSKAVKIATVTSLKKKKSSEDLSKNSRTSPNKVSYNKLSKDKTSKHSSKRSLKSKRHKENGAIVSTNDSGSGSQFEDTSNEASNFGSCEHFRKNINAEEIKQRRNAVVSDSFFQHLFLRNMSPPNSITSIMEQPNTSVLEKAKLFQSFPPDYCSPRSINSYLIHKKPVSQSKFRMWDRFPINVRPKSPRSISWPGRMLNSEIRKFDSLSSQLEEFGSTSSLATVRSRSEPPANMMFFSQTSRPKSPIVIYHKKDIPATLYKSPSRNVLPSARVVLSQTSRPISPKYDHTTTKMRKYHREESPSPTRIILTQTSRPISPPVKKRTTPTRQADTKKSPTRMVFSETSRPVSPAVTRKIPESQARYSRSKSPSPTPVRSPSCRRIHSARNQGIKYIADSVVAKKHWRTRSAGDVDDEIEKKSLRTKTFSDPSLDLKFDPDYTEYILEMQNEKSRSDRFRELNRYYCYLERVGVLEKATSSSELRHRRKDEEIIDFDRWKKIRSIERAEEELDNLYRKLKTAQKEDDVLFYPRDVKDFRWNFNTDRSLRVKEKSVENLKEHFQDISDSYKDSLSYIDGSNIKDAYTPLWRGNSVADVAYNINRKNELPHEKTDKKVIFKPVIHYQETSLADLRKKLGLGSRLWSSLSMEQVNTLKNQLNAIYSKDPDQKPVKDTDEEMYTINVTKQDNRTSPSLHVRCNSLTTECSETPRKIMDMNKSDSISAINYAASSEKELKNNVNKIQMTMSENEKKKISHSLSKEVLNRVKKVETPKHPQHSNKVTAERPYSEDRKEKDQILYNFREPPTKDTGQLKYEETKRYVIYPPEKHIDTPVHASSASETETASSDQSNKTVIYRPKKQVQKKVEYFETVTNSAGRPSTIHHAKNDSGEQEKESDGDKSTELKTMDTKEERTTKNILQSQSCANFRELFGETEANKFTSLPLKPRTSRSPSLQSEGYRNDRYPPETLRYSSEESLCRSRSESPDPERYWRAYLNLVKAGEVKRLARRFDSPSAAPPAPLRRYRSDPEIARSVLRRNWSTIKRATLKGHERGDVDRLTHGYELRGRNRSRRCGAVSPVARAPLRAADRFMPHIDVISKLAALRRRAAASPARARSAGPAECPIGEVERMRRRFERMSLLGQLYTSAPDVRELHLAGEWAAHRYPSLGDNNRSPSGGGFVRGRRSPVRRERPRLRSASPPAVRLSSILKPETGADVFANQPFDPAKHRPVQRYQPPPPPPLPRPPPLAPTHPSARPTVTFQEPDPGAPEPPPKKSPHGSYSDTESPRRYVESDVNIHYRCPVRRDPLPHVPERELARRQAEHMRRLYQEERRRKYLQELQDMQSRRHTDNFTPAQKAVVPLNRYDEPDALAGGKRAVARALYAFAGQSPRELTFRKGDVIGVRRQVDANWYEGELNGKVGLFPYNYVEILKGESQANNKPAPATEGRARAKFDFTAQTNLELPLKKGEVVILTRRIDQNWWEGRHGSKTGIFPDSYVQVLAEPSLNKPEPLTPLTNKPLASPASHGLLSGGAKHSMGSHSYQPQLNSAALSNGPQPTQPLSGQYAANYHAKPAQATLTPSERGYGPASAPGVDLNNREPLYIDTNAEAVPYRAMYKYRPQNPDELELSEGDTVYVLEQCDDGWYVGSSQRSGKFGTFPGNYVERI